METKKQGVQDEFLWNQFIRLGEMIGDGLHEEADGRWISKEYKRLTKILVPEMKEEQQDRRKRKAVAVNEAMDRVLLEKKCECGGCLKQTRSGTKICACQACGKKYKLKNKR